MPELMNGIPLSQRLMPPTIAVRVELSSSLNWSYHITKSSGISIIPLAFSCPESVKIQALIFLVGPRPSGVLLKLVGSS